MTLTTLKDQSGAYLHSTSAYWSRHCLDKSASRRTNTWSKTFPKNCNRLVVLLKPYKHSMYFCKLACKLANSLITRMLCLWQPSKETHSVFWAATPRWAPANCMSKLCGTKKNFSRQNLWRRDECGMCTSTLVFACVERSINQSKVTCLTSIFHNWIRPLVPYTRTRTWGRDLCAYPPGSKVNQGLCCKHSVLHPIHLHKDTYPWSAQRHWQNHHNSLLCDLSSGPATTYEGHNKPSLH